MQKKVLIQFADFAHDHVSCFIMIGTTDSHAIVSYQNPICLLTLLDFRTCLFQGVAKKKKKKNKKNPQLFFNKFSFQPLEKDLLYVMISPWIALRQRQKSGKIEA